MSTPNHNYNAHWQKFELRSPEYTIGHASYTRAMQKLNRIFATEDDTWLAQLVAPTGAGKTHTATVMHGLLLDKHAKEIKADATFMPSVYVSMSLLSDKVAHSWSDDYWKILVGLKHAHPRSENLSDAREKLTEALTTRRTQLLILDEAAHFISGCSAQDISAIKRRADVVKSLTEDTKTRLLICGTYDLLPMVRINGQLSRRNQIVHLERYRNTEVGRSEFLDILATLDARFSQHLQISLVENEDFIYERCIGLVGVLRNWLVRASTEAESQKRLAITKADLEETVLALGDLTPILEEALNGEEKLDETEEAISDFRKLLDSDATRRKRKEKNTENADSTETTLPGEKDGDKGEKKAPPPKKTHRPGRSNPHRPPTGESED